MLPKTIRTGIHRYEETGVRKTQMAAQYRKAYVPVTLDEKEVKWSKHAPQTVEIHYADIGCTENRKTAEPEQHNEIPKVS